MDVLRLPQALLVEGNEVVMEEEIEGAPKVTEPEKVEPPKVEPPAHVDHTDTIHSLTERISTLESTVQSLLPENKDETPVKKPWTHRGLR